MPYKVTYSLNVNNAQAKYIEETLKECYCLFNEILRKMINTYNYIISSNEYKKLNNRKEQVKYIKNYLIEIKGGKGNILTKKFSGENNYISVLATTIGKKYPYINSSTAQLIACNVSKAWDKKFDNYIKNGKNTKLKFKSIENPVNSFSLKKLIGYSFDENISTLILKIGKKKIYLPIKMRGTEYDMFVIKSIKDDKLADGTTIKKEIVRGKIKYYLQISLKDNPYNKGRKLGEGKVGIDPGINTVTSYGNQVRMDALDDGGLKKLIEELASIERKMERSRRINNPQNYNENGTIKNKKELTEFNKSKNYIKLQKKRKEIYRKIVAKRKIAENILANKLLSQGNVFNVEKNNFAALAKKSKETTINKKTNKYNSKKRFGKLISTFASSEFLTILKYKVVFLGGTYNEINVKIGCTQFDHTDNSFTKHSLNERIIELSNGNKHTRDAHAAFNIKHAITDSKEKSPNSFNLKDMENDYDNFCTQEKLEIVKHKNGKQSTNAMGIHKIAL